MTPPPKPWIPINEFWDNNGHYLFGCWVDHDNEESNRYFGLPAWRWIVSGSYDPLVGEFWLDYYDEMVEAKYMKCDHYIPTHFRRLDEI